MAITVTTQKILDSTRNVILKFIITGTSDNEIGVLYDPNNYIDTYRNVKVMKIKYELQGFSAYLNFDDSNMISLASNNPTELNFEDMGGILYNNAPQSGRISIKTNGLGAGDIGTIILLLNKVSDHGFNVLDISPNIWSDSSNRGSLVYDSNGNVSQQKDLSGNGNHFNQATAGRQPNYMPNSLNNRDTILFTRNNKDCLIETTYGWPLLSTIFIVIRPNTLDAGTVPIRILSSYDGSGDLIDGEWAIDIYQSTFRVLAGFNFSLTGGLITKGVNVPYLLRFTCDANKFVSLYVDQALYTSGTTLTTLSDKFIGLGGDRGGSQLSTFRGDITETIIKNSSLSNGIINTIETYLISKWGITV